MVIKRIKERVFGVSMCVCVLGHLSVDVDTCVGQREGEKVTKKNVIFLCCRYQKIARLCCFACYERMLLLLLLAQPDGSIFLLVVALSFCQRLIQKSQDDVENMNLEYFCS